MRPSSDVPSRTSRLILTIMLAMAWTMAPPALLRDAVTARADDLLPTAAPGNDAEHLPSAREAAEKLKPCADKLDRVFRAVEAADHDLPHEEFQVAALAKKLGADATTLFLWTRDNTYWVPYHGILRGPAGVLMDRLGNSWDRSLLLAALLRETGHEVRIAYARLAPDRTAALLARIRPFPSPHVVVPARSDQESVQSLVEKYAQPFGLDPAELRTNAERVLVRRAKAVEEMIQSAGEITPALQAAAGKAPDQAGPDVAAWASDSLSDHAWVQVKSKSGWTDLDPLLPDGKAGERLVEPEQTLPAALDDPKEPIAAANWHEVELRVVVERSEADGPKQEVVLSKVLRPATLIGKRLVLSHVSNDSAGQLNLLLEKDPAGAMRAAVLVQREWAAVLQIDLDPITQGGFDVSGKVKPNADVNALALTKTGKKLAGAAAAAASAFGGGDAGGAAADKPNAALTAEWLEFELRCPGRRPQTFRRDVFDLIGPAARAAGAKSIPAIDDARRLERGLALSGQTEILIQPCELSPLFVEHLINAALLADRPVLMDMLRTGSVVDLKSMPDRISSLTPVPGVLYDLAAARHRLSPVAADTFVDQPCVLTFRGTLVPGDGGAIRAREGIDIVANGVGVRWTSADPFRIRVLQGAFDTVAEACVQPDAANAQNTSRDFAMALARDEKWLTLRDAQDPALRTTRWPAGARARIEEDLRSGYLVVAPAAQPPAAANAGRDSMTWWRIDPKTGQTLGVNERGEGATMAEYAQLIVRVALMAITYFKCMSMAEAKLSALGGLGCTIALVLAGGGIFLGSWAVTGASAAGTAGAALGAGLGFGLQ